MFQRVKNGPELVFEYGVVNVVGEGRKCVRSEITKTKLMLRYSRNKNQIMFYQTIKEK